MTELIKNKIYNGFLLESIEAIDDIASIGYIFNHVKSGAKLFYIKNEDDNKVFSISFKTLPTSNKGVAHILEHSVLCGSKKYPINDPFNELAKGSLNTYLNAMTYGDKTMYPIASRNDKDFQNLMDVYLDAVFNPLIYERKEIFMQEGWHYDLESSDASLSYKGVVYNEMKGALSDPDRILNNCILESAFPDSPYRFESGGDPEDIPLLSYEDFIEYHKTLYHPSNSFIYLYGDLDIFEKLEYIDSQYLNIYDKNCEQYSLEKQKEYTEERCIKKTYSVTDEKGVEDGSVAAVSFITGESTDPLLSLSLDILCYILLETNDSPLKKMILDSGICQNVEGWFDSSSLDMVFSVIGRNIKSGEENRFKEIVYSSLEKIFLKKIDESLISSSMSVCEFHLLEENYGYRPKGLAYGMKMMKSWLHGADPCYSLMFKKHINEIRKNIPNCYFENIIKKYFLDNGRTSFAYVTPECGKQNRLDNELNHKLETIKNNLTSSEKERIIDETKRLFLYQSKKETNEELKCIPVLDISDIEKKANKLNTKKYDINGEGIIFTPMKTSDIVYAQIIFDTTHIQDEMIPYVGLISQIMDKIGTEEHDYYALPQEVNMYTGGISLNCNAYSLENGEVSTSISFSVKMLSRNIEKAFELADEIISVPVFDDTEHLKIILGETKTMYESILNNNGHMAAAQRCLSYFSKASAYKEKTEGIEFFDILCDMELNPNKAVEKLKEAWKLIFETQKPIVAVGCTDENFKTFTKTAINFLKKHNSTVSMNLEEKSPKSLIKREGIYTSWKVNYNAKAANFKDLGYKYSGKLCVLRNILNLEYLWNTVRVQGGAYGCGSNFSRSGDMYFYSYRDPNICETISCYDLAAKFIENFSADESKMRRFIIGAINVKDKPLHNEERADIGIMRYMSGISDQMIQKERDEILDTKEADIQHFAQLIKDCMDENYICTLGNKGSIEKNEIIFEKIIPIKR